jgi:hypothetical protein
MTKAPRFGFDINASLNGAQPRFLTTPMEGPASNRAEAHLIELFSTEYCDGKPRGADDQGNPLPLPIVDEARLALFIAKCELLDDPQYGGSTLSQDVIDTGSRKVRILWFKDGSGIFLEELASGNFACLPVSIFLSKGLAEHCHEDIEAWCQAMRRMPEVLPHCGQSAIDKMTEDQCVAPWGNFSCNTYQDATSGYLVPVVHYAMITKAHEVGPARFTFEMFKRRIQRDGSIGPATVKITARSAQLPGHVAIWFPEELQGIADLPDFPKPAWKAVSQYAGHTFTSCHALHGLRYSASATIDTQPSAHEVIEARAAVAHLLQAKDTA